jgi:hypothetical protein
MAKAQYHRGQKVWVESVGAWAVIEKLTPIWAKGFNEPVRITYDVGFGRDFMAHELRPEEANDGDAAGDFGEWRLLRAKNKWQTPEDCAHHPYPGTYPVVVTDKQDWGGWRTPGAEYDRDPRRIEMQALLIANTPKLLQICRDLHAFIADAPQDAPEELQAMAKRAAAIIRSLQEVPVAAEAPPKNESSDPERMAG